MIIALVGEIFYKEPTKIALNCRGVVYEVFVSLNTSNKIQSKVGDTITLLTTHIIREDAQTLYGFLESSEKRLFDTLIKINGVGPKVAMAILSTYTPSSFANVVSNNDIKSMQRVPGIGPKSAGRILVDLSGWSLELASDCAISDDSNLTQVIMALESLGYKGDVINKAIKGLEVGEVGTMVKNALKKIQGL